MEDSVIASVVQLSHTRLRVNYLMQSAIMATKDRTLVAIVLWIKELPECLYQ